MNDDPRDIRRKRADLLARLSPLKDEHLSKADELRGLVQSDLQYAGERLEIKSLIGQVPGFIPTPRLLAIRMVSLANIRIGMQVLEPGAGAGAIADVIRALDNCYLHTIEINPSLCKILWGRGYQTKCADFLDHVGVYDRIIANPPFENLMDIVHVLHMYRLLAPRGRIVTIMSNSSFTNSRKIAVEFREWLDQVGGTVEKLPSDTFKFEGANVNSHLVVIDKP